MDRKRTKMFLDQAHACRSPETCQHGTASYPECRHGARHRGGIRQTQELSLSPLADARTPIRVFEIQHRSQTSLLSDQVALRTQDFVDVPIRSGGFVPEGAQMLGIDEPLMAQ